MSIGAFAGGLEQFLRHVPARKGMGVGIIQHLAPTRKGLHAGTPPALHPTFSPGFGHLSTFSIQLPLLKPSAVVLSVPQSESRKTGALVSVALQAISVGQRILLADDHGPKRWALQRLLQRWNDVVLTAASLSEASVRDDGRVLMSEPCAWCAWLPGIALSEGETETDREQSRLAGFAEHLVKPVTVPRMEQAITSNFSPRLATNGDGNNPESHR